MVADAALVRAAGAVVLDPEAAQDARASPLSRRTGIWAATSRYDEVRTGYSSSSRSMISAASTKYWVTAWWADERSRVTLSVAAAVACLDRSSSSVTPASAPAMPASSVGHDDLGGLAVAQLLERLEVLDGQQVGRRVAVVDGLVHAADGVGLALGHGLLAELLGLGEGADRLGPALGLEDRAGLDALGLEDGRRLLALGGGDGGRAATLGLGDHGAPGALGLHLLVHGRHDVRRRIDALDLDPDHPHAPLVGGVVEDLAQGDVDLVAGRERLVELEVADDVAQVGLGQLGDGQDEVGDVVDEALRVGGLVVDDGVDRHGHVVRGDDLLRRHVDDLLAHVDGADRLDERDDDPQPGVDGLLVLAQLSTMPRW